jgi:hypothetical protein
MLTSRKRAFHPAAGLSDQSCLAPECRHKTDTQACCDRFERGDVLWRLSSWADQRVLYPRLMR